MEQENETVRNLLDIPRIYNARYVRKNDWDMWSDCDIETAEAIAIPHCLEGHECGAMEQANRETIEGIDPDSEILSVRHSAYHRELLAMLDVASEHSAEIAECIMALQDYPILDESRMSGLEHEQCCEDWEDYGRRELRQELESIDESSEELTDEQIDEHWHEWCQNHCEGGWRHEIGSTLFFDLGEVAKTILVKTRTVS